MAGSRSEAAALPERGEGEGVLTAKEAVPRVIVRGARDGGGALRGDESLVAVISLEEVEVEGAVIVVATKHPTWKMRQIFPPSVATPIKAQLWSSLWASWSGSVLL